MSPDPLVPDFVPEELIAEYGTATDRQPRRRSSSRFSAGHMPAEPPTEPVAVEAIPRPARRGAQRLQAVAVVFAIELSLLGMVGVALWWTALASTDGSMAWTALTYGGWVVAMHLPAVLAVVLVRMTDDLWR